MMKERLTHRVYEAALNNSLWPEIIAEIAEYLDTATAKCSNRTSALNANKDLLEPLTIAFSLNSKILQSIEHSKILENILDSISIGIAIFDNTAEIIFANSIIKDLITAPHQINNYTTRQGGHRKYIEQLIMIANRNKLPIDIELQSGNSGSKIQGILLPKDYTCSLRFPRRASAVLLVSGSTDTNALRQFAIDFDLTLRESDLVSALVQHKNLKRAANDLSLSYESARTYLKRIFSKSGSNSQSDLISKIQSHPITSIRAPDSTIDSDKNRRVILNQNKDRNIEFFQLGNENSYPVFYFDEIAVNIFDILGSPNVYMPCINRLNLHLISVCRPGTFRTSYRKLNSLRELSDDILTVANHLGIERFSIISYSYGSSSVLGVAHELADRIDRIIMAAPSCPMYSPNNWREMDVLHQLTNVIGQKGPELYKQILPFLTRSLLQDIDCYFDKTLTRSKCTEDIEIISNSNTRKQSAALLRERAYYTIQGIVQESILVTTGWDFSLENIDIPFTILHGEMDDVTPPEGAQLLAKRLPNVSLYFLKNKGHYFMYNDWWWMLELTTGTNPNYVNGFPKCYRRI
jgi:pimeloyl-ACP methyl ester carboxylesterase/DNA-binding CsgD family transcriptional regulator